MYKARLGIYICIAPAGLYRDFVPHSLLLVSPARISPTMKAVITSLSLASATLAATSSPRGHTLVTRNSSTAGTKVILDNDWSTAGFVPYLLALDAGWDVLGLVGDTSNSWALQTSLHGLATLEVGNLSSCIPVYKGSDYPLVNTPELFHTWEDVHGDLVWVSRSPSATRLQGVHSPLTSAKARRLRRREPDSRGGGQRSYFW